MSHHLYLLSTTGTGSLDLAGLGVVQDLGRGWGQPASPAAEKRSVEQRGGWEAPLCSLRGVTQEQRCRRNKGMVWSSSEEGRKME